MRGLHWVALLAACGKSTPAATDVQVDAQAICTKATPAPPGAVMLRSDDPQSIDKADAVRKEVLRGPRDDHEVPLWVLESFTTTTNADRALVDLRKELDTRIARDLAALGKQLAPLTGDDLVAAAGDVKPNADLARSHDLLFAAADELGTTIGALSKEIDQLCAFGELKPIPDENNFQKREDAHHDNRVELQGLQLRTESVHTKIKLARALLQHVDELATTFDRAAGDVRAIQLWAITERLAGELRVMRALRGAPLAFRRRAFVQPGTSTNVVACFDRTPQPADNLAPADEAVETARAQLAAAIAGTPQPAATVTLAKLRALAGKP
jgi:hypothetical protein